MPQVYGQMNLKFVKLHMQQDLQEWKANCKI